MLNADASGPHASTELADTTGDTALADAQTLNGTLVFTDVNFFDTHTVSQGVHSITWSGGSTLPSGLDGVLAGALTPSISPSSDDSANKVSGSGLIHFTFSATDNNFDFLANGETLTVVYDVTVTDDDGAISTQPVTFVITGTNDQPVITSTDDTGAVTEDDTTPICRPPGALRSTTSI